MEIVVPQVSCGTVLYLSAELSTADTRAEPNLNVAQPQPVTEQTSIANYLHSTILSYCDMEKLHL